MQPDEQLDIAQLLSEQRAQLEEVIRELAERPGPLSELEARLLTYDTTSRLLEIEHRLRVDARSRPPNLVGGIWLGATSARILGLAYPKIGRLEHYAPRPLRVPEAYLRTTAPNDPPRISVVTPSFQQGRYVARTMASVIGQKYPKLEYIVQDGGSTDGTVETLRQFADRAHLAGPPSPTRARPTRSTAASPTAPATIMAWLNSDDMYLPGALAYVARYFADHPDVDVVYGNRLMIDAHDGEVGAWILPKHDDRILTLVDYVPQETLFWRRSIWEAAGGRLDTDFDYAIDWDLLFASARRERRSSGSRASSAPSASTTSRRRQLRRRSERPNALDCASGCTAGRSPLKSSAAGRLHICDATSSCIRANG